MVLDDDVLSVDSYQSVLNITSSTRLPKIHKVSMLSDHPGYSDHLVLPCVVNNSIVASSIPDSGATSQFMDHDWAHANGILLEYGNSRAGTQSHCYFIGLTYNHLLSPVTSYHT